MWNRGVLPLLFPSLSVSHLGLIDKIVVTASSVAVIESGVLKGISSPASISLLSDVFILTIFYYRSMLHIVFAFCSSSSPSTHLLIQDQSLARG